MKRPNSHSRAFTLIELLVVIAIIGILTGIVVTNMAQARGRARDAKRVSDIGQIQLALELYYDRCKQYPATLNITANNCAVSGITGITLETYISKIPTPPVSSLNQTSYTYASLSANSEYTLSIILENYNEVLKDGCSVEATKSYCVKPR